MSAIDHSGDTDPGKDDIRITGKPKEFLRLADVRVLDNVVAGACGSWQSEGSLMDFIDTLGFKTPNDQIVDPIHWKGYRNKRA